MTEKSARYGIIPEFSFVLGNPPDPEADVHQTLEFIRKVKRVNSSTEIIMYVYTPVPLAGELYDQAQAQLAQANGQLAQAKAQLTQAQAQLSGAEANQHRAQLDEDRQVIHVPPSGACLSNDRRSEADAHRTAYGDRFARIAGTM